MQNPMPFRFPHEDQSEVDRLRREGRVHTLLPGVGVRADAQITATLRALALGLVIPPRLIADGATVAFLTAAWVYSGYHHRTPDDTSAYGGSGADSSSGGDRSTEFPGDDLSERGSYDDDSDEFGHPGQITHLDLVLPPQLRRKAPGHIRLRQLSLRPSHTRECGNLTITTPARTVADLARDLPAGQALAVIPALTRATDITRAEVLEVLRQMPGTRGRGQASDLLTHYGLGLG